MAAKTTEVPFGYIDKVNREDHMELIAGQYRIDGMAGCGGFGRVYRGYDVRMERMVAIKQVCNIGKKEAGIITSLEHRGLPQIYDLIDTGNCIYMILEWIDGIDLERYIEENGAIEEDKAIAIGEELVDILSYLHSKRPAIVYQDLKPSNIMLKPDGHIKLVDFGTAVVLEYGDDLMATAGTIGYGSPEQRGITGEFRVDERSDIYAWGAVMYTLLSGRLLSRPPYTMDKIRRVCPHISFGVEKTIKKCVERNPNDRYQNTGELKRAIEGSVIYDIIARIMYIFLSALCICPFVFTWYIAYREGLFNYVMLTGMQNWLNYSREIGLIMISAGWMFGGLRLLVKKKYIRVNRSVYLSGRRFPGLWIATLIAGVILGYGMNTNTGGEMLPVNLRDETGNRMLVQYDASLDVWGDLDLTIDRSAFDTPGDKKLLISLINKSTGEKLTRVLNII